MAVESRTALALAPQEEDSVSQTTSLLLCSRKRRRTTTELESEEEEEEEEEEGIKKLPDVLLMDILCRLDSQRAFQCRSVSKHWNSLISHPYFVHHRHCHRNRHSDSECLLIVLTFAFYVNAVVTTKSLEFFYFLKFLPFPEHHLSIYASFNDLLLVRNFIPLRLDLSLQFIICNPFTRQWLAIPPIFSEDYQLGGERDILVGLIIRQQENYPYSNIYKVVRIHCPFETTTTQIKMEIFSSETGEWCNLFVESPRVLSPCNSISRQAGVFPCNGMLHWVDADQEFVKGFLVYDPFNDIGHLGYIDPPVEMNFLPTDLVFFGVFRGRLRIIQRSHTLFSNRIRPRLYCFSVWELEDYANAGTWCLKCKIKFSDIVSQCPRVGRPVMNFLAFHTNVAELVLFQFGKDIKWYNMHTKVFTEIGKLPVDDEFSNVRPPIFLLGYQSWPTPIPRRPLELE